MITLSMSHWRANALPTPLRRVLPPNAPPGPHPAGLPARGIPVSPARKLKSVGTCSTIALLVLVSAADIGLHTIDAAAAQKEELRDPFVFGPRETPDHHAELVVIGVLWDAAHPLAMVGEATVGVGDQIGDWRVIKIQHDGILIEQGERRKLITTGMAIPED